MTCTEPSWPSKGDARRDGSKSILRDFSRVSIGRYPKGRAMAPLKRSGRDLGSTGRQVDAQWRERT